MSDTNPVAIPTPAGLGPIGSQIFQGLASVQDFLKQPAIARSMPIVLVALVIIVGLAAIFTMREPAMTWKPRASKRSWTARRDSCWCPGTTTTEQKCNSRRQASQKPP